jgi:hypothetical protein
VAGVPISCVESSGYVARTLVEGEVKVKLSLCFN